MMEQQEWTGDPVSLEELALLVRDTLDAQKHYYTTKTHQSLVDAKVLEKSLRQLSDQAIRQCKNERTGVNGGDVA